jgi:hypothetical protein
VFRECSTAASNEEESKVGSPSNRIGVNHRISGGLHSFRATNVSAREATVHRCDSGLKAAEQKKMRCLDSRGT